MKKALMKSLSLTLAAVLLVCMLPACSGKPDLLKMEDPERSDAFFDIACQDPADSYSYDLEMQLSGSLYGLRLEAELDSETVYVGLNDENPIYHTESESVLEMGSDADKTTQTVKNTSGYRDGKMYESSDIDGEKNALVSAISAEDYLAHLQSTSEHTDEELSAAHKSASVKECKQNEDGTWTATFSSYSEENIDILVDYCFDSTVLLLDGYKISDVILTIDATEELISTEWKYELVFERTDMTNLYAEPRAVTTISFEDIGTAEAPELDLSTYTEVEALADLRSIRVYINDLFLADSGSFTAETSQNVTLASSVNLTEETDIVTYKTEDGKFSCDIKATVNRSSEIDIVYKDGLFTMSGKDIGTQTQEMSDTSARAYISRIFDPAGLTNALISDIKTNIGKYTHSFTIANPDYSAFETSLSPMGAKDFNASASVDVIYEDGVLKEYKYSLLLTAKVSGQTLTVDVTSTITFDLGVDNEM